ncbi:MAG: DUF86 domain-containing protein [Bacteroidetes bacterium]|nr:DUF86 domain-containing protein [Bacteroidota bacterium]
MRDYKLFLKDIYVAVCAIEIFIGNMSFEEFSRDDKTISAVLKKFEIIGEASKRIPTEIKNKYPSVKWKEMAGSRDILIHTYFGSDINIIWDTIKEEIPPLKITFEKILNENNASSIN